MKTPITPAALGALASGDLSNFLLAATPGGIEAQEKRGQIDQSLREALPVDGTLAAKYGGENPQAAWEAMGFVFEERADDLFVNVTFPEGWKKSCTDHSMWTDILDDKGRKRAAIFYKAAFYDRSAHVHFVARYSVNGYADSPDKDHYSVVVSDGGKTIKEFGNYPASEYKAGDELRDKATKWLAKHYPDYQSPAAYWDQP